MYLTDLDILEAIARKSQVESQENETLPKKVSKYPATNISTDKEEELLFIEIACPGFTRNMLKIEHIEDFGLHITGKYKTDETPGEFIYYQQDISRKDFVRKIKIDDKFINGEITVDYSDGLLIIMIKSNEITEPKKTEIEF